MCDPERFEVLRFATGRGVDARCDRVVRRLGERARDRRDEDASAARRETRSEERVAFEPGLHGSGELAPAGVDGMADELHAVRDEDVVRLVLREVRVHPARAEEDHRPGVDREDAARRGGTRRCHAHADRFAPNPESAHRPDQLIGEVGPEPGHLWRVRGHDEEVAASFHFGVHPRGENTILGAVHTAEPSLERSPRVYRWDLDKTYLRTEFDTARDLLKLAFESAAQKRTVPGAAALLREITATQPLGIYIVSGSPEQLRRVLEKKLRLDGIRWDSFTLKPQLSNILRGRFRFIKDQVSYKLRALLESRALLTERIDEYMFGDDAEADAFIYSVYSDLCAGRVDAQTFARVLERTGLYEDDIPRLVRLASKIPVHDVGRRIFIHLDRVSAPDGFSDYGARVCPFYNYLQPALVLLDHEAIDPLGVVRVAAELVMHHGFTADALAASFTDMAERGHVGPGGARRLVEAFDGVQESHFARTYAVLASFVRLLELAARGVTDPVGLDPPEIDYVSLFSRDKARARLAKKRLMRR